MEWKIQIKLRFRRKFTLKNNTFENLRYWKNFRRNRLFRRNPTFRRKFLKFSLFAPIFQKRKKLLHTKAPCKWHICNFKMIGYFVPINSIISPKIKVGYILKYSMNPLQSFFLYFFKFFFTNFVQNILFRITKKLFITKFLFLLFFESTFKFLEHSFYSYFYIICWIV